MIFRCEILKKEKYKIVFENINIHMILKSFQVLSVICIGQNVIVSSDLTVIWNVEDQLLPVELAGRFIFVYKFFDDGFTVCLDWSQTFLFENI